MSTELQNQSPSPSGSDSSVEQSSELAPVAPDPLAWLTAAERYAYDTWEASVAQTQGRALRGRSDLAELAPAVQVELFNLYLAGRSLAEIREANKQWSMGQVVSAAIKGAWNVRRDDYLSGLLDVAKQRATQVQAESIKFIADTLAANNILHGAAVEKFLQTHDPRDLGAFGVGSIKQYGDLVAQLMKLTGQEGNRRVTGAIEHTVNVIPNVPPKLPEGVASGTLAALAEEKRQALIEERKG